MDLSSQVIILIANLLSGKPGTLRWETVTAIFGWIAVISLIAFLIIEISVSYNSIKDYLFQVFEFSLLTALFRDYERILHPLFPWNKD